MKNRLFLNAAALALLGVCGAGLNQAEATLLAYESFAYAPGSLNTQNGGTGWGSGWTVGGAGTNWQVTSSGLNYTGLTTAGNATIGSGNPQAFRNMASSAGGSGSVYLSFLLNQSTAGFGNITLFNSTTELFSFGDTYTGSTFSSTYSLYKSGGVGGGGYINSGVNVVTGAPQLLVLEIDYSTPVDGANLYFYLNPTIGATAPLHGSAIVSTSTSVGTAAFSFNRIRIEGAATSTLDEVRIADNFADAVAVPEPSTMGLLALGVAGLFLLRRRGVALR